MHVHDVSEETQQAMLSGWEANVQKSVLAEGVPEGQGQKLSTMG